MSPEFALRYFLPAAAFVIGACIGSFLNVVIYRLPNGLRVNEPRRSFCPACKRQIPFYLNIPLVSWVMLGGKCRWCGASISFRYFLVELLTAFVFLAVWLHAFSAQGWGATLALWSFVALLIAATYIDLDHFIIPDSITLGGLGAGLVASFFFPALHGEDSMWRGLVMALAGAALGYGLLWLVVLMGKMMFGKIAHQFDEPVPFTISQPGGEETPILIKLGDHEYDWQEVFFREWDRMEMDVDSLAIDGASREIRESFHVVPDGFEIDGEKVSLETVKTVSGTVRSAVVPREAMGFGDVKFIAMIGAFLGWQAVLFTIFSASVIGAVVGVAQKIGLRETWSRPLPFGPYLALGAFLWLFTGPALWMWYLRFVRDAMGR